MRTIIIIITIITLSCEKTPDVTLKSSPEVGHVCTHYFDFDQDIGFYTTRYAQYNHNTRLIAGDKINDVTQYNELTTFYADNDVADSISFYYVKDNGELWLFEITIHYKNTYSNHDYLVEKLGTGESFFYKDDNRYLVENNNTLELIIKD